VTSTTKGMLLGLIGVAIFSMTLPMTRLAIKELDPLLLSSGRALAATIPAALMLWFTRARWPNRLEWRHILPASIGIVLGWPTLSSLSMKYVPAAHGALINGLLPIVTALTAARLYGERPSKLFWGLALLGSTLVVSYALIEGKGSFQPGDGLMLCAVALGGLGYASGAEAARTLGGWQTICWALCLAFPFLLLPGAWLLVSTHAQQAGIVSWAAFAYLAFMSQFVGFFAWYSGLAIGGTARVGQVQLLQMFMTVSAAALLFGEPVSWRTWTFAAAIVLLLYFVRRIPITQPAP
jgi:drug/metabolite transporter (DMT)-like permease